MNRFTGQEFLLQKTTWLLSIIIYSCERTLILFFFLNIVSTEVPHIETRLTVSFPFPKHSMGPSWKAWHVYCFSFFHSKANLSNDYTQPCVTRQLPWVPHKVTTFPSNSLCQFAPKRQPSVSFHQKGRLHVGTVLQWIAMQITSLLRLHLPFAPM